MTTALIKVGLFFQSLLYHLRLSVSSIKFHENVFTSYRGYGVKYIFSLSAISSLICCAAFLAQTNEINNYLSNGKLSRHTQNIDQIINQLPIIEYNGRSISIQEDTPFYVKDLDNKKLLAIDPNNKLSHADKNKFPILLTKNSLIITINGDEEKLKRTLPLQYIDIIGTDSQIINQEFVKSTLLEVMKKAPSLFIYLIFPILTILLVLNSFFDKLFMIIMIFFITKISKIQANMQSCIRSVMFASGFYTLLHLPVTLILPIYIQSEQIISMAHFIILALQVGANFLMILGILKATKKPRIFRF